MTPKEVAINRITLWINRNSFSMNRRESKRLACTGRLFSTCHFSKLGTRNQHDTR